MATSPLDGEQLDRIRDAVHSRLFRGRAEAVATPTPGLGDRYRVLRPIGRGGASVVWEVEHTGTARLLAAKVLALEPTLGDTATRRLLLEARAVGSIRHPNVVEIIDVDTATDGRPFLVMERLVGRTLHDVVRTEGPLAPDLAVRRLRQIASGLAAAHRIGLVHRDVKSANVMIVDEGTEHERCKVLDFGLARWHREGVDTGRLTRSGAVFGTPTAMSPEQINRTDVDNRADIYSLGCLAWELIAGRPPFVGETIGEVLAQQLFEHPPSPMRGTGPARIERALDAWIRRCMRKRRDLRFADMDMAIAALDTIVRGGPLVSVPDETGPGQRPHSSQRWLPLGLALGAIGASVVFVMRDPSASASSSKPVAASLVLGDLTDAPQPREDAGQPPSAPRDEAAPLLVPLVAADAPAARVLEPSPPALTATGVRKKRPRPRPRPRPQPSSAIESAPTPVAAPPALPVVAPVSDWGNPFERALRPRNQKRNDQPPAP